ncbi:hypothetical protein BDN72DRAFT_776071, partial [Pluteus cervinus]
AIEEYPEPHCWRLIKNVGDEKQEAVFSLHGIIVDKDLPPITVAPTNTKSCPFLRQQITLSGLNCSEFEYAVDKARDIYNKFRRFFPEKQLLSWPELKCVISEGRTLTLGNRYFTRRSEAPTLQPIPFELCVDPNRVLAGCVNAHLFHSADNTVNYYRRYKDDDGELVHDVIPPQNFRIGDIVDTQFCFVVYRMRPTGHRPMVLNEFAKVLTLLSRSVQVPTCDPVNVEKNIFRSPFSVSIVPCLVPVKLEKRAVTVRSTLKEPFKGIA